MAEGDVTNGDGGMGGGVCSGGDGPVRRCLRARVAVGCRHSSSHADGGSGELCHHLDQLGDGLELCGSGGALSKGSGGGGGDNKKSFFFAPAARRELTHVC